MEEAALLVEEDNLEVEQLELLCELARSNVCVDVEDLARFGLGEASQNGEPACADGIFQ